MRYGPKSTTHAAGRRSAGQRLGFALLVAAAGGLMILGKVDAVLVDRARAEVTDLLAPIMAGLSRPAAAVARMVDTLDELGSLRDENARLRTENEALRQFQDTAYRLEVENRSLQTLLNYQPAGAHAFITARVIADNSGAFLRSVGIDLGRSSGVVDGQAAIGSAGLIGRVVQAGERSARILLLTDFNARIPVVMEQSRHRGVLAGDNSDRPELLYLPPDAHVRIGDRVVTSGDGGMFPAGLPVGTVAGLGGGVVRVQLLEDLSRLEFARIMDFPERTEPAALRSAGGIAQVQ